MELVLLSSWGDHLVTLLRSKLINLSNILIFFAFVANLYLLSSQLLFSATLGSGDVDLCLIPEVPIVLDGEKGCMPHVWDKVKTKGYCVIVVAEGAGEELLGESTETDASGNKKLPAIGEFLKKEIGAYFKSRGEEATVKYIDPSYMIRSVAANATDSLYCMQLGQNAVHGKLCHE